MLLLGQNECLPSSLTPWVWSSILQGKEKGGKRGKEKRKQERSLELGQQDGSPIRVPATKPDTLRCPQTLRAG